MVTGEWFLEERSKRFEQGVPSTDVVKQTILSSPASESHSLFAQSGPSSVFFFVFFHPTPFSVFPI